MPDEPQSTPPSTESEPALNPTPEESPSSTPASESAQTIPAVETEPPTRADNPVPAGNAWTPTPSSAPEPSAGESQPPIAPQPGFTPASAPKPSKKKMIVGVISAVILVILLGGGALAYNLWYQNPDKVVADGLAHLLTNTNKVSGQATMSLENKQTKLSLSVTSKTDDKVTNGTAALHLTMKDAASPVDVNANADFALDDSNAYFKIDNLKSILETAINASVDSSAAQYEKLGFKLKQSDIDAQKQEAMKSVQPIIAKLDNKWIKVNLTNQSEDKTGKCMADAVKKLQSDKATERELMDVYQKDRFIIVKKSLGSKNGSLGYALDFDKTKAKQFSTDFKNTSFAKQLAACDGNSQSTPDQTLTNPENGLTNSSVELWVSRWSHQITGLKVSGTSTDSDPMSVNLDLSLDYKKASGLSVPSGATDINDLQTELGGSSPTPLPPVSI